jgi:hypothetical protein
MSGNGHSARRFAACAAVAVAGFLASCGGNVSAPQCSFFSNVCNPEVLPGPAFVFATLQPTAATVQVGGSATFVGEAIGIDAPFYQWSRSDDGGASFVAIPRATASSLVFAGARLTDDAVVLLFSARSQNGAVAVQARAVVRVSSMPPVVHQDTEFSPADWTVSAIATPAASSATHDEQQVATGGNPGAFRTMTHRMPSGAGSLSILNASTTASYDPASQGAIYVIDYAEDCRVFPANFTIHSVGSTLLVDQGGRRFAAKGSGCMSSGWSSLPSRNSLAAADFNQIVGPGCGIGESCPDFAATAAPLRFGFVRILSLTSGQATTLVHDIDNWKVSIWRR